MLPEGFDIAIKYICHAGFLNSIDTGRLDATSHSVADAVEYGMCGGLIFICAEDHSDISYEESSIPETESTTVGPPSPPVLSELECVQLTGHN